MFQASSGAHHWGSVRCLDRTPASRQRLEGWRWSFSSSHSFHSTLVQPQECHWGLFKQALSVSLKAQTLQQQMKSRRGLQLALYMACGHHIFSTFFQVSILKNSASSGVSLGPLQVGTIKSNEGTNPPATNEGEEESPALPYGLLVPYLLQLFPSVYIKVLCILRSVLEVFTSRHCQEL